MKIDAFLSQLCEHCGVSPDQLEVTVAEVEDRIEVQLTIPEEESGRFIGYHGDALQAIQRVLRLAFEKEYPEKKIILNVNDYRERRLQQLEEKVTRIAQQVLEDGQPYTFNNFIPSHERYAIHTVLATLPDSDKLESFSAGEGMSRRLTIALKQNADSSETVSTEQAEQTEEPANETQS